MILYILIERSDGVYIDTVDVSPAVIDAGATFLTHLDRKVSNTTTGVSESYSSGTDRTTITLPYTIDNTMKLVGSAQASNVAGQEISIISQSGTSIVVAGDITSFNYFIGEQYTFTYQFSQQYMA